MVQSSPTDKAPCSSRDRKDQAKGRSAYCLFPRPPNKRSPFGASVLGFERCRGCESAWPTWTESSVMHGSNLTHSGLGSLKLFSFNKLCSLFVVHIPLEYGSGDQNGNIRILVRGWIRKLSLQAYLTKLDTLFATPSVQAPD
ncbi:hypothetical protein PAHAL_1G321200 [Panicum hallii]|uniref:Uncharacterized protein n=1 Tax=Panicum hallii TaxID=206008 RepID=A0A2S3GRF0_9POAL|nr:hypothetical protein PAHAL_1G321200 [Panicum hallii]